MVASPQTQNGGQKETERVVCAWDDSFSDGCRFVPHRLKLGHLVIDWGDACTLHAQDHWHGGTFRMQMLSHGRLAARMLRKSLVLWLFVPVYIPIVVITHATLFARVVNPIAIYLGASWRIDRFWGYGQRQHRKWWSADLELRVARQKLKYHMHQPSTPGL